MREREGGKKTTTINRMTKHRTLKVQSSSLTLMPFWSFKMSHSKYRVNDRNERKKKMKKNELSESWRKRAEQCT